MKATKRDLIGRRIVEVHFNRFASRPEVSGEVDACDPRIVLDNGRTLFFVTNETEIGEYGTTICINERRTTRAIQHINGNVRDNRPENLRVVTLKENL